MVTSSSTMCFTWVLCNLDASQKEGGPISDKSNTVYSPLELAWHKFHVLSMYHVQVLRRVVAIEIRQGTT